MKKHSLLALLLVFAAIVLLLTGCGSSENITVTVVNRTAQEMSTLYMTAGSEFGESLLDAPLADGEMVQIDLGDYSESDLSEGFAIYAENAEGEAIHESMDDDRVFNIADGAFLIFLPPEGNVTLEITSTYNPEKYEEAVVKGFADLLNPFDGAPIPEELEAIVGYWKYEAEPYYLLLTGGYEWSMIDLHGECIEEGSFDYVDGWATLLYDGEEVLSLTPTESGGLMDADGGMPEYFASPIFLPTAEEEFEQTVSFPTDFSDVEISYPASMSAQESEQMRYGLSFDPLVGEGTDDYYANITASYQPVVGYDPYLAQGKGQAETYMQMILNDLLETMYGDKVLKTIGSSCTDCGSYYKMIGYIWLDSTIFVEDPGTPVRGTIEIRYFGPTGYLLVGTATALESRIQNYFEICSKMLDSCTYNPGWSTSPKEVPQAQAEQSDSADTPYYWYDEDGDVWYWNGSENEFIGYGTSYYIDEEDGRYYESNDDGWDFSEEYDWDYEYEEDYDPWSDPGYDEY